jgi:hypothetical protein
VGMPNERLPFPSGLGMSTCRRRAGSYLPSRNCSRMRGQSSFR